MNPSKNLYYLIYIFISIETVIKDTRTVNGKQINRVYGTNCLRLENTARSHSHTWKSRASKTNWSWLDDTIVSWIQCSNCVNNNQRDPELSCTETDPKRDINGELIFWWIELFASLFVFVIRYKFEPYSLRAQVMLCNADDYCRLFSFGIIHIFCVPFYLLFEVNIVIVIYLIDFICFASTSIFIFMINEGI